MINTVPFEVSLFSGGITDNYIDGDPRKAKEMDNILLTTNMKMVSRNGFEVYDVNNAQVPSGQQRINHLLSFDNDTILINSIKKFYYLDPSFQAILGPSGNDVLSNGDSSSNTSSAYWNDHYIVTNDAYSRPMKIYKDGSGNLQVRNAGLPELATSPTVTIGLVGTFNYIYAFSYYYEYTSGQLNFIDIGPTTQVLVTNADNTIPSTINNIPVLSNGSDNNWDTANIKVKIYRTVGDGDVLYEIGEVNNGTTSFNDNNADEDIQSNQTIYTNGGVLDNDEPPRCKFVHITNSICLYANIQSGSEILKNRIIMSIRGDIDSAPSGNIIDVDDEIVGVNSVEHIPVVFCKRHIYRIDGFYDSIGDGNPIHQKISDTVGCISNNSIIQTDLGTFFAGNDGFYWTDSFKVRKVSNEFNERYRQIISNNSRIYASYDEESSRIYWSVQRNSTSADLDTCFVLDLRFGISEASCFTTISGVGNFFPTSTVFFKKELIHGDNRGYIFRHNKNIFSDDVISTLIAPSLWNKETIIWNYESCSFNFGTTYLRKMVSGINTVLQNETNISLAIISNNDDGRKIAQLKPIRFRGNLNWGDEDAVWYNNDIVWNYDGFVDNYRRFPAKGLRCNFKQIQFTNAFVVVSNSDSYGEALVNSSTKQAVLNSNWPSNYSGYEIFFSSDNYTRGYPILSTSSNTLTYQDTGNTSPSGNQKWIVKGFPKNEIFSMISYCIHYAALSKTQEGFRSSGTGENG